MTVGELVKLLMKEDQSKKVFIGYEGNMFSSVRSISEFTDGDIMISDRVETPAEKIE